MSPLGARIARQIAATGPLSLAQYMAACLMDPEHGYYATRDPLGAAGDFTTAPEISQMFGELLGLCLAQSWLDQGAPKGVLAEAGPGRGTLMADILRATRGVPGMHQRLSLHLIEASPALRAVQAARLPGAVWHGHIDALPEAPLWFIANEFFDALPIRQFVRAGQGWREVVVGVQDGRLVRGLTPPAPLADLAHRLDDVPEGGVVETCPSALPILRALADRIGRLGGAAIIVDYGGPRSLGDTFQAVQGHAFADPFAEPGLADLTAHVDFGALVAAVPDLTASALTPQGDLLRALGIEARAERLARNLTGAALDSHRAALHRLTDAQEMGTLFKALALVAPGAPLPPGFAPGPTEAAP